MATLLFRLGRFSFRRRTIVAAVWAVLLVLLGAGAATLSGQMNNSVTIPGTESQRAVEQLKQAFPQAGAGNGNARVVLAAPQGATLTDPANRAAIAQVVGQLRELPKVSSVAGPFQAAAVSPDSTVAMANVTYGVEPFEVTDADRDALRTAGDAARQAGLQVEFGGTAMQAMPETGIGEVAGVAVAAIVLLVTFGSVVAAGLPLLTAFAGVGVGIAGITIASGFIDLNANTPVLALMIGLAVGIDYALFVVSRYRHEVSSGREPEQAAAHSVATAGSAVLFAGLTVIIALAGLTVVGIPFLGEMGIAAAGAVAVTVLIALTLLPAVLGFAGMRVLGKRSRGKHEADGAAKPAAGRRWAGFVSRHRVPVLVGAIGMLLVTAVPATAMQLGLPNDSTAPQDSTRHKAYELVSSAFGPGANGPLTVVVDVSGSQSGPAAARAAADQITGLDDVAAVTPPQFNPAGDTALLNVIPASGPTSEETKELVASIRDQAGDLRAATGAGLAVTGQTAMNIDVSDKLADAMVPYLALIAGLAFLLLMVVFRSIMVPLKATVGFLGSVAAAFGAVVAVFQWGWLSDLLGVESTGPIMSILPILLIGVLFGLAMDYQVFLVTRMREEYVHGAPPDRAIVTGFGHGSRVVVAAALIMTSVFAGFVLADNSLIQSIGFALAIGVAVDAFVVRMTIVPAVMSLLGRHAWWLPRWLDRLLPNVDVEGSQLTQPDTDRERGRELQAAGR